MLIGVLMSRPNLLNGFDRSQVRWIVFDAVGTLIQPNPSVAAAYHTIGRRYGSQLSVEEISERFHRAFRQSETDSFPGGPSPETPWLSSNDIESARWNWIVGQVIPDVDDAKRCFQELWDHFASPQSWRCFEDVGPSLRSLREAGYRLAIASNFDSRLHSVCDGLPDLQPIEHRFVSSETGYRKPSGEFYSAVLSRCECTADQILMVGDDLKHDVTAAISKGMRAMLIDRRSNGPNGQWLTTLQELVCE